MKRNIALNFIFLIFSVFFLYEKTLATVAAPPPGIPIPTLNEWGMIGTAVILGTAAVYSIFRRK